MRTQLQGMTKYAIMEKNGEREDVKMTELEMIERARMYVQKLANGENPIDGSEVPDGDVVNNVRISRCLFFVADVLGRVLENGGTAAPKTEKKPQKLPFELTFEQRERFEYSETPITMSELARRLNALIDTENMTKLPYTAISSWLTGLGLLETVTLLSGKLAKRPTEEGLENGITVVERIGQNGPYHAVVYDAAAQRFVLDNLDAIIAVTKDAVALQGTPWTQEQDEILAQMHTGGTSSKQIAAVLKRRTSAITSRLKKLGLK